MNVYTITVRDPRRNVKRPLAVHPRLTSAQARELRQVYAALGHEAGNIRRTQDGPDSREDRAAA